MMDFQTAKTVYEQPPPVYHEPKVIVETQPEIRTLAPPPEVEQKQVKPEIHRPRIHHRDKIIHLIALNRSISGNMRGIRGADLMCYQQARQAGFKTTFRAFISSRVQDLLQIVHREDRDTPVVNIRGEKLFEDWASVFTQTSMPSNVPIYSFTYRDVLQGDEWPDKYIWHGSDEQGLRTDGFYCEDWRSSSGFAHGMASALLRGRPLITDAEKISCRRELIVLCVENMSKFNVNRLLRGKQRKFRY
uniref:Collagenase NC10/endostatin domain-containing protein n=1 Tax=Panagrolaimus sp. JU765 TaxID=591449 RepID=A0AC34PZL1_9BILA